MSCFQFMSVLLIFIFEISAYSEMPEGVRIRGLRANGLGCPLGSAQAVMAPDAQSFSLLLDNYLAQADLRRPTARRDCDLELDLDMPAGWSYALVSADYRGFVDLPEGTLATHRVVYAFEQVRGRPGYATGGGAAFQNTEFRGPRTSEYLIQNQLDFHSAPRSSCSMGGVQTLYMNTLLTARLMGARSSTMPMISLDSVDGQISAQQFKLAWFRCDQWRKEARPEPPIRRRR